MRVVRAAIDGTVVLARLERETVVPILVEQSYPGSDALRTALAAGADLHARAEGVPRSQVRLLPPVVAPQKILAVGLNYADHALESRAERPSAPLLFMKAPSSIIGPEEPIAWGAEDSREVDYEAELAVIVGRTAKSVSRDEALEYVFGYTCCNDVSARDAQFGDGQWTRGKSFDTFCPLGPSIVTASEIVDPQHLRVRCRVNGQTLQDDSTAHMIFGVADIVSYASQFITLEPGDVIATGTPQGVGFARIPPVYLAHGDVVEVEIEGVGTLRNPVVVGKSSA